MVDIYGGRCSEVGIGLKKRVTRAVGIKISGGDRDKRGMQDKIRQEKMKKKRREKAESRGQRAKKEEEGVSLVAGTPDSGRERERERGREKKRERRGE